MNRLMQRVATWGLATALGVVPLIMPRPAHAGVHVDIWLPGPPVVVSPPVIMAPPPVVYAEPPVVYGAPWYGYPGGWHRHHHRYWRHHGYGRHHGWRHRH